MAGFPSVHACPKELAAPKYPVLAALALVQLLQVELMVIVEGKFVCTMPVVPVPLSTLKVVAICTPRSSRMMGAKICPSRKSPKFAATATLSMRAYGPANCVKRVRGYTVAVESHGRKVPLSPASAA